MLFSLLFIIIGIIVIYYFICDLSNTKGNYASDMQLQNQNNLEYTVYFCPEDDCNIILYNHLSNTNKIDCAVYDITLNWFYSLMQNKQARIITDNGNYKEKWEFVKTDNSKDYMHNKFCILDSNILLIGSTNFTYNALEKQNNNFIITNNKILIVETQKYFEELWKGNFNYGYKTKDICFSPSNCMSYYIEETKKAKKSIKCMFFSFTYNELSKELIQRQKEGLDIKIIMEKSQNSQYSEYNNLNRGGVKVIWDQNPSHMHNKFCILDSNTVITGSMNPSNNGNFNNNESIIIINNEEVTKQYENYFDKYYSMWR